MLGHLGVEARPVEMIRWVQVKYSPMLERSLQGPEASWRLIEMMDVPRRR